MSKLKNLFHKQPKFKIDEEKISSPSIIASLKALENKSDDYEVYLADKQEERNPLIKIKEVTKDFGAGKYKKEVLKGINLTIYEGEHLAILGGNGAGKTVLVETIAGLNKPTSGTIEYCYDYKTKFQERLGIQFQDSSYPPAITVKEVIDFMIEIYGSKVNPDELMALLKIFGIDSYYKKRANKLSGGQQQRLNCLLALIHKPKILFLDELSTGLDITIRTNIKRFIKSYAKENGITLVIVSHDMDEVEFLADYICVLKNGLIVFEDSKEHVLEKYHRLEKFITPYL